MKKIFPFLVFILCTVNLYSQWGVKGGINYSTMTGSDLFDYYLSGHMGATYDLKLSSKWYFQPGLFLTSMGSVLKSDNIVIREGHVHIYAFELPLTISFHPKIGNNMNLIFDFGLFARIGVFGKKKYKYYEFPEVDKSPFDDYNRFDTGINLGVGIQVKKIYGLIGFQRGLSHAEDGDGYHQAFKFSLGYKF